MLHRLLLVALVVHVVEGTCSVEIEEAQAHVDVSRAQAAQMAEADSKSQGFDELWLGDSILNFLALHKDLMQTITRDGTSVFVAAVPGDTVNNLLWRLEHGGHVFHNAHPKIIVVMIGTNDFLCTPVEPALISGTERHRKPAGDIGKRIRHVLHLLLKQYPAAQIVNVGLLPQKTDSGLWPNTFTEGMELINVQLRVFASREDRVHFVDCSHVFLQPDDSGILPLLADGVHPNVEGNLKLLQCFDGRVAQLRNATTGDA